MKEKPTYEELERRVQELERIEAKHKHFKEEVRARESLFKSLYEKAPLGYQSLDESGCFIVVNQAWLDTLGYTQEEVIGKSFADFLHPDWRDHFKENFPRFKAIGEILGVEFEMVKKNGDLILVSFTGKISRDEKGNFQQTHCIFNDITERKQAEDTLRRNEKDLKETQRIAHVGSWRLDLATNRVVWTEELYNIYGIDPLLPPPPYSEHMKLFTPESWERLTTALAHTKETGIPYTLELETVRNDGSNGWMWVHGEAKVNSAGETVELWGAAQDITKRKQAETQQKENEKLLNVTFEAVDSLLIVIDKEHQILLCNWKDHEWVPVEERKTRPYCYKIMKNLDSPCEGCLSTKTFKDGQPRWFEDRNPIDGSYKEISVMPIFNVNGEVEYVLENVRDVTERKRAEEALLESESQINSIFRSAPVGIGSVVNRLLSKVNKRLCEMTGYDETDLVGRSARMLYLSDEDFEFVGREKYAQIADRGTGTVETRWQKHDGTIMDVLLSSTPVNLQDHSRGVTFTALDITERKRAEESLRESELTFRKLFEDSADAILLIDKTGVFVECNQAALTLLKTTREQLLFKQPADISPEYQPDGQSSREKALKMIEIAYEKALHRFDWTHINSEGIEFIVELSLMPIKVKGELMLYTSWRDITERKRAEAERESLQVQLTQAQKMESVGRLAGGVAHDFNNMLGVIIGLADMLLIRMDSDNPFHDDLTEIRKAGERSADLTRKLLAFARKQTVAPKVIDFNDTIENMLKLLGRLIGEDIDLLWKPGYGLWPVKMDPTQIDQILANLCVNARDAISGVGKVTIETNKASFDEEYCTQHMGFVPGDYVLLAVSDNGCGMDIETTSHLFEPFFTTKEVGKGTGLGLATVYGAVKQNNGFINVYSEPGQGTTFKIYLPSCQW